MIVTPSEKPTNEISKFVESKQASSRFKDWGEIVERIRHNNLIEDFASQLDPSVRSAYKQCFDQATDPHYEEQSQP